jgi:hypothetical protein
MMFQLRFRQSRRSLLSFFAIFYLAFFIPAGVSAGATPKASIQNAALKPYSTGYQQPKQIPADGLCLFTLHDGDCKPRFFDRRDLVEGRPLKIQGYVVGVVVFGPDDLKVQLDKQHFFPIQSSADGTFMVRGYGKVNPSDLAAGGGGPPPPPRAGPKDPALLFIFSESLRGSSLGSAGIRAAAGRRR